MFLTEAIDEGDYDAFMHIVKTGFSESGYAEHILDERYFQEIFRRVLSGEYFGLKCTRSGEIVGFIAAHETTMGFCNMRIGMDDGFYVVKGKRGGLAAKIMLEAYKAWCGGKGIMPALLIHFGRDNNKTYEFLAKLGFRQVGAFFMVS